jgi:glycerophosphoryl diester phosphodiesterase
LIESLIGDLDESARATISLDQARALLRTAARGFNGMSRLDRKTFLRPIAHRGLHDPAGGVIENAAAAFDAAIAHGYAIECDLQPAADGTAMVFHDATLERLTGATGRVDAQPASALQQLAYKGSTDRISTLGDLFDQVGGRVPLVIEIKTEWRPLPAGYLARLVGEATAYKGPLALMSFDPVAMAEVRTRAPGLPLGIVSGHYRPPAWWSNVLTPERQERLTNLLDCGPIDLDFVSYNVDSLPTPVTRYVREVQGLPLICWTVRTPAQREHAQKWADAPTFEGYEA